MRSILQVLATILLLVFEAPGREAKSDCVKPNVALVTEIKGVCYVREDEGSQPRKLTLDQGLLAGQALQCETGALAKIQFCPNGVEKIVRENKPKWYIIPNPALRPKPDDSNRGGRKKAPPR